MSNKYGDGGMKRDNTSLTMIDPTMIDPIGTQQMGVDTGSFQLNLAGDTPAYTPGKGVSWMKRAGMNIGEAFGGVGSKLSNMSAGSKMGIMSGVGGILQGIIGGGARRARQRDAKTEYTKQRKAYAALDARNLSENIKNPYENMENVYEDMTVNQQQAQFEAQQGAQSRANIMQNLQGAAGSSGIGALAQAMANQSQLATQRAGASIGMQESRNQALAARGADTVQQLERRGAFEAELHKVRGAEKARDLEWQKQEMALGMAMQEKAEADRARQQATNALVGGIGTIAGSVLTGGASSVLGGLVKGDN